LTFSEDPEGEVRTFTEADLREMARHSIDELQLSNRSYNALMNAQLFHIDKLAVLTKAELSKLRNLGKKSQQEVESELEHWLDENGFGRWEEVDDGFELSEEEQTYFQRIVEALEP
ncbi:DNA-directed RNA polymerase subunit alpha C-terminal domain-containing protein, partial [Bacillus licheniformis]|uniref:DNA-directed RNA polymerase subunit alpha C-terminal domain-containing protein n=1 Tax=Bacillus licheniformis TaxID=1402 RepID=UPI0028938244